MFRFMLAAAVAALVFPICALSANPNQPNRFELQASASGIHNCLSVGEIVGYSVTVTNISNHTVIATVSPSFIGNDAYSFGYVSSKPKISSTTTNMTDMSGASYSYKSWMWQRQIKAGATTVFTVAVKVPDWNFPTPPYTNPDTGEVYYAPAPQPYPQSFVFDIGVRGSTGGTIAGARSSYCEQTPGMGK
jgi:hypothetical protein